MKLEDTRHDNVDVPDHIQQTTHMHRPNVFINIHSRKIVTDSRGGQSLAAGGSFPRNELPKLAVLRNLG